MRPPWLHGVTVGDELEALQTDVMRFIAILGLCLVAIFSLVNGAQREQAIERQQLAAAPAAEPEIVAAATRTEAPEAPPAPAQVARESSAPEPDEPGFTLEFESAAALGDLLAGGQLQLFVLVDGNFKRYFPDGVFRQVEAPESYYQMDAATVPQRLRLQAGSLYSEPVSWGVILPAAAVSDIQRLVSAGSGGKLLIGADAGVRLASEDTPGPAGIAER